MDADAKLLAEIANAIATKDTAQLKDLQNKLKRYAWLKAWKKKGGKVADFLDPNPFVQFED